MESNFLTTVFLPLALFITMLGMGLGLTLDDFKRLIIVGLLLKERDNVVSFFLQVGGVTVTLNILTMALGYGISTLSNLDKPTSKAITVEVGIQNGTLAIAIASTPALLNMPTMAIPAAIYSLLMFVTSLVFAWLLTKQSNRVVKSTE